MKTRNLLSAILVLTFVCMSFIPTKHVQKNLPTFKHHSAKFLTPSINPTPGPGAKEYTVEVTGAATNAVGIQFYIIFNGDPSTKTQITVSLDNGYGFLDQQTSFDVVQTDYDSDDGYSYLY